MLLDGDSALLTRRNNAGTMCEQRAVDETAVKVDFRRPRVPRALPHRLPLRCLYRWSQRDEFFTDCNKRGL